MALQQFQFLLQLVLLRLGLLGDIGLLFQVVLCLLKFLLQLRIANGLPWEGNTYATLILGIIVLDDECRLWTRLPDDGLLNHRWEYAVFTVLICLNDGDDVDQLRLDDLLGIAARCGSSLLADVRLLLYAYDDEFPGNLLDGHHITKFHRNDVDTHIDVHDFLLLSFFVFADLRIVGQFHPTVFQGGGEGHGHGAVALLGLVLITVNPSLVTAGVDFRGFEFGSCDIYAKGSYGALDNGFGTRPGIVGIGDDPRKDVE